jgi:Tfp pilus assembly protein PilV
VGASPNSEPRRRSEAGFTLVEVVIAAMILIIGLLSLAQLLGVSIRAESLARHGAEATRLAQGQLDALMKADFDTDPRVQVTPTGVDSLNTDVANYFNAPSARSTIRWRVSAGPAGTRVIQLRVSMPVGTTSMRIIDLTSLLRRW